MLREWIKTVLTAAMLIVSFYGTFTESKLIEYDKETVENFMVDVRKTIRRLFHFIVDAR